MTSTLYIRTQAHVKVPFHLRVNKPVFCVTFINLRVTFRCWTLTVLPMAMLLATTRTTITRTTIRGRRRAA